MIDDIVTRLRDLAMKEESPWANIYDNIMREVADEIEYLRNELAELNGEYQKLWNKHNAVMRDRKYPLTNDYIGDI